MSDEPEETAGEPVSDSTSGQEYGSLRKEGDHAMSQLNAAMFPLGPNPPKPNGGIPALQLSQPLSRWDSSVLPQWMEEDLREARHLQILMLPRKLAGENGLEIAAGFRPAHGVSGDIFDLFDCGDGRVVLTLGDVSGKGAAAAIYGAVVSGLLWSMVERMRRPARLLRGLNDALLERKIEGQNVSLLAASWQAKGRRLRLASAGAIRPLVCRSGIIRELDLGGVPLGLWGNWEYEEASLQLEPGEVVVFCSDGLMEQENGAREPYGRRMAHALQKACQEPPRAIVDAIFADLDRFAGLCDHSDDQTLAVLKVT